ncbi:MAG TPA: hypothetical protein VGC77_19565 [Rhodopseudomonas sp.]|uniref:hypothetical protein n=1 Tax=Rhodopseudomonas sp. TaxID=1078 RepID=UPI002ED956F0
MNSWKQERDRFGGRTQPAADAAAAHSPTGQHELIRAKHLAAKDFPPKVLPAKDLPAKDLPAKDLPAKGFPARDLPARDLPARDLPLIEAPLIDPPPARRSELDAASERADIVRRVAAFRDHQIRIRQQREAYYDAVLAKTRAALRSDTGRI